MSEKRKYRTITPEQKAEIVLAGLRGDRTVRDIYREYESAEKLYSQWRDRVIEAGKAALATPRVKGGDPRDPERKADKTKVPHPQRAPGARKKDEWGTEREGVVD